MPIQKNILDAYSKVGRQIEKSGPSCGGQGHGGTGSGTDC